jgi:tetratricopeptide (TPR) repeat protein/predicted Ser/Thr protein kinase
MSERNRDGGESADDVPPPGSVVGRYVILGTAGRGGQAVVLLAYDPQLDRRVALKLLPVAKLGGKGRERLLREAQALARLSHPNVVPVYDVGTVAETAFLSMEFVDGVTLDEWLAQPRTFSATLAVMRDAGRGLAAAHDAGLVHRDFKPSNVLIGADGRVRVVDFGLARSLSDTSDPPSDAALAAPESASHRRQLQQVTRDEQVVGTPAFMSPESLADGTCDARSDQYSFGVTLRRALLHGQPDGEETVTLSIVDDLPPSRARKPARRRELPAWLERLSRRMVSVDPAARYPSMAAALAALDRDPATQRRRWLGVGAIGLLAAAALAVGTSQRRHERLRCQSGEGRIATVWSEAAAARIHRAFAATPLPYAPALADAVSRQLGAYANRWAAMDDESCVATHVRGEQSEEALDLRSACLERRRGELAALVNALGAADKDAVSNAGQAVQSLTPLAECADVTSLRAEQPRPRDAAERQRVSALEARVAEVQARFAVGQFRQGVQLGESLLREVTAAGYLPLVATLELWLARCYGNLEDAQVAMHHSIGAHFSAAFSAALQSHADHLAAEAAAWLATQQLYDGDPGQSLEHYQQWAHIAEAAIGRAGGDALAEIVLLDGRCTNFFYKGRFGERMTCREDLVRKLEDARRLQGKNLNALALSYVDMGRLDDGVRSSRRAVQLSIEQLGPNHPSTIADQWALCYAYNERGEPDQALAVCESTLRVAKETFGRPVLASVFVLIAEAKRLSGHFDEASAAMRALAALPGEAPPALDVDIELGLIADSQGRHADALKYLRTAVALAEKMAPAEHPNVIMSREVLGEALLHAGDRQGAQQILEPAEATARKAQMSPLWGADLRFALAQSLPSEQRARALELARGARAGYATAPPTERFRVRLAAMNAFLATE